MWHTNMLKQVLGHMIPTLSDNLLHDNPVCDRFIDEIGSGAILIQKQ